MRPGVRFWPGVLLAALIGLTACQQQADAPAPDEAGETAAAASPATTAAATVAPTAVANAFQGAARLGRGVNLGNALEAPREGEWGLVLEESYFQAIAAAGFDAVRLPVKWSAHAAADAPYQIEPAFFERIDWAIAQAEANDLAIVLNIHHYDEIMSDPAAHRARLLGLWAQIAPHYQDYSDHLYFEILNEPFGALESDLWNDYLVAALAVIRQTNPTRPVIIGPTFWNNFSRLPELALPADDRQLIVTFHYYDPFEFTHQGAEWVEGAADWLGRTWTGTAAEQAAVQRDFEQVAAWAAAENRPVFLGEFGAYQYAPSEQRTAWTAFVRATAEAHGFAWAYWEFGAGFGVYDRDRGEWREPLLRALLP